MKALILHPSEGRLPKQQLEAEARRVNSRVVQLVFCLRPALPTAIAGVLSGQRGDELWKQTCFECFVAGDDESDPSYEEWNFAPNGDWAAYEFSSYRQGMRPQAVAAPKIEVALTAAAANFTIEFELAPARIAKPLALSLTAVVVESQAGAPFYWALAHAGEKPDFHRRESFRLNLK